MRLTGALHVHSDYSHDGRDTLEGVRAWAVRAGIGFVGMTEHAEDLDSPTWARYRAHCDRLSDEKVRLIATRKEREAALDEREQRDEL